MSKARFRSAATPSHRPSSLPQIPVSVDALVRELSPLDPLVCLRPAQMKATAARFVSGFAGIASGLGIAGGDVLYAVKCNPEPAVLRALWRGGVRHFDCASLGEIRLVRQMFADAAIHYMHPIKPEAAVREAYFRFGVRDFSLDSAEEVEKIVRATEGAQDLGLFIRLAMPKGGAKFDLSAKFGASVEAAAGLLRMGRAVARQLGVCFHVGSQCLDPAAYARALDMTAEAIRLAGVAVDTIDVGGGFPVAYPDEVPPALDAYFAAIRDGVAALGLPAATRIWCEPGRALVAAGASVVVRVEAVRGGVLHINDGVYGTLADAGTVGMRFPARLIRRSAADTAGFAFYGPTCDSADYMAGPFALPADVAAGDYIELGQLGAYGTCLRTAFNGFDRVLIADVTDRPLLSTPGHPEVAGGRVPAATPARRAA